MTAIEIAQDYIKSIKQAQKLSWEWAEFEMFCNKLGLSPTQELFKAWKEAQR